MARAFLLSFLLAVSLAACDGCAPQEARLAERLDIREALAQGVSCADLAEPDSTRRRICMEERDRLRLRRISENPPAGMPAFDYRDAFLCLYPPTVRETPWSDPKPMPNFVCRVPPGVMDRLR